MKDFYLRMIKMIFGLFLYALGIVITLKANIGFAPWDVFHVGLSKTMGISIGTASILVGLLILLIVIILGEKLGFGSVFNMFLVGIFLDLILKINLVPQMKHIVSGIIMLISGMVVISVATYFYIGSAFGAGPRDSLMVALTRKTKIPVGICRGIIELSATVAGWFLGGMVGIGTVITVIGIGFCIQLTFKVLKFDVKAVKHESLKDTLRLFFR